MPEPVTTVLSTAFGSLIKGIAGPFIKWAADLSQNERAITRDHDIAMFRKLDEIANEPRLCDILGDLLPNSRARLEDDRVLSDLIESLNRIENAFLDKKLKLLASQFAKDLEQALIWVRRIFGKTENGFLKFYPHIIDSARYDAEWKEVSQKLDKAWTVYKDFRLAVKEILKV